MGLTHTGDGSLLRWRKHGDPTDDIQQTVLTSGFEGRGCGVKLAETLVLRADAVRRSEQLRARVVGSARFQEGVEPAEDAAALLVEAGEVLDELKMLSALPVAELRERADRLAREVREIDVRIPRANWKVDLLG